MYSLSGLYKSLIVQTKKVITKAVEDELSSDMDYYAWDARGEESELPETDLLGLSNWTFKENGGLWQIRVGLVLSTYNDTNLFRQVGVLDIIHDHFGEETQVPMLNSETGEVYTNLVVSDFDTMPAGQSERRNYLPVMCEMLRTASGE